MFENLYDDAVAGEREEKEEKPKNNGSIHIPDEYGKVFEAISIYQQMTGCSEVNIDIFHRETFKTNIPIVKEQDATEVVDEI